MKRMWGKGGAGWASNKLSVFFPNAKVTGVIDTQLSLTVAISGNATV